MSTLEAKAYATFAVSLACGAVAVRTGGDTGLGGLPLYLLVIW